MKIVVCPDKFKGSMTASEVAYVISSAVSFCMPDAEVVTIPMADGGEGSVEVLTDGRGEYIVVDSVDPLMRPIKAKYGLIGDTAVIDLSQEIGLMLLSKEERNPEKTSSYGFGMVIGEAVRGGAKRLILCIGGSATNDCGIGLLSALGVVFTDANGVEVEPVGGNLGVIEHISSTISDMVPITVVCDVTNVLYGSSGAAYVYAPQKGADGAMCERLDSGLRHFSDVVMRELGIDISSIVGGGAAGGIGAALVCFLNADMVRGGDFIAREVGLYSQIVDADLVITGEGRVDSSTLHDKLTHIISSYAAGCGVPVVVFCGVAEGVTASDMGVLDIVQMVGFGVGVDDSIARGASLLRDRVTAYFLKYE